MTKVNSTTSSLSDWKAGQLRLTAFPESPLDPKNTTWWQSLIGEPPEVQIFHPKLPEQHEEGPFGSGRLTLRIQPHKIDWLLRSESGDSDILSLAGFPEFLNNFTKRINLWLENDCPDLSRIAFGAVLLLPAHSRENGYELIANYLPAVKIDPKGSSDFLFQINRQRKSNLDISDLKINRLCKWSISVIRHTLVALDTTISKSKRISPDFYAGRLELDINTSQDFQGLLAREHLVRIYKELVDVGKEIVEKGDIP